MTKVCQREFDLGMGLNLPYLEINDVRHGTTVAEPVRKERIKEIILSWNINLRDWGWAGKI